MSAEHALAALVILVALATLALVVGLNVPGLSTLNWSAEEIDCEPSRGDVVES